MKHLFIFGMLVGTIIMSVINAGVKNINKQNAVKEYLQHPENYAIQYVYLKGDTVCTDIIVTYLK